MLILNFSRITIIQTEKEENKGCVFPVMTRNSHEKGYNFIKISPHGTTLSDILLKT